MVVALLQVPKQSVDRSGAVAADLGADALTPHCVLAGSGGGSSERPVVGVVAFPFLEVGAPQAHPHSEDGPIQTYGARPALGFPKEDNKH